MDELRAKSSDKPGKLGELLIDHLLNGVKALRLIRERIGDIPGTPAGFWTWATWAILLHDTGKLPDGFQRMIGNTPEPARPWGERHEILSLGFVQMLMSHLPPDDRLWTAAAVAGHHRPLTQGLGHNTKLTSLISQYGDDRPDDFAGKFTPADQKRLTELLAWLHQTAHRFGLAAGPVVPCADVRELTDAAHRLFQEVMNRWENSLPFGAVDGRTAVLLLGSVTMADHLSSAHSPLETRHPLNAEYPSRLTKRLSEKGHTLRPQQRLAAETNGHLLLRSWTGSGKTEAALLWALPQLTGISRRTSSHPRVFYLLPYLASINAMVDRLAKDLESPTGIGVAHSKAASYHLARALADGCPSGGQADTINAAEKAHSRHEATKNFRELLRVGTPYRLLRGVLAGPVHSSILTDAANSVFILDELHAYDARRLGMILAMMRFWRDLGGHIAVLSATIPTALEKLVQATLGGAKVVEPPTGTTPPVRHRLHLRDDHLTDDATLAEIRGRLAADQSVLVVANNVRDAIDIYEMLRPFCIELHGEGSAYLLHSRYRRMDRTAVEIGIRKRFASGHPHSPGLLVGTQAVEVSLDLDLDVCHTSAADLEALIQRFGRINRLCRLAPAPVIVHRPRYAPRHHGSKAELWADGVYQEEPTRLGWEILTRHNGKTIDEQVVTDWLDEIYDGPWGQKWKNEVDKYRFSFTKAFLTFPQPFDDRAHLADKFDEQFDGTEAILAADRDDYANALHQGPERRIGRLFADDYLIPLPSWGAALSIYDRALGVRIIEADYNPQVGLLAIHHQGRQTYQLGEIM